VSNIEGSYDSTLCAVNFRFWRLRRSIRKFVATELDSTRTHKFDCTGQQVKLVAAELWKEFRTSWQWVINAKHKALQSSEQRQHLLAGLQAHDQGCNEERLAREETWNQYFEYKGTSILLI